MLSKHLDECSNRGAGPGARGFIYHLVEREMRITAADTLEALGSALTILTVGETVCIFADDFKRLTGDNLADFATEGRFMIGNLSARTNCTVATTDACVTFTKNPPPTGDASGAAP